MTNRIATTIASNLSRFSLVFAIVMLVLFQFSHAAFASTSGQTIDRPVCANMMGTGHDGHSCDYHDMADGAGCSTMSCSFGVAIFEQTQVAVSHGVTFAGYRYCDIEQVRSVNLSAFRKPPKQS